VGKGVSKLEGVSELLICYPLWGSVSKVEMVTSMVLIYKVLFPSISTFETPPQDALGGAVSFLTAAKRTCQSSAETHILHNLLTPLCF
jgi:hypothetical protein